MNQIARCDWLPERARWSHLARSGLPAVSREPYNKSFIDQVCSVKMAGYWPRSFFCKFMDLDFVSVHKHAKKELGQYPAILTEQTWSINHTYLDIKTSASHLTKKILFSCISLFFLLSYVFYIHPIGHFQVAFCLCVKTSLNMRNHSYDLHLQNSFSHGASF